MVMSRDQKAKMVGGLGRLLEALVDGLAAGRQAPASKGKPRDGALGGPVAPPPAPADCCMTKKGR